MAEGENDKEQKTEHPTGKRLSEAREKGQLPVSREVGSWFMFFGVVASLLFFALPAGKQLSEILQQYFVQAGEFRAGDQALQYLLTQTLAQAGLTVGIMLALMLVLALLGTISQTGFFASTQLLEPKWDKINPITGFKQLFSTHSLVELGKGCIKIILVGWIGYATIKPFIAEMDLYIGRDLQSVANFMIDQSTHLVLLILGLVTIIAAADLIYTRWRYIENLKMTKQEVKDEHKQSEGDPMIRARLRGIRLEKARRRMMSNVPKADVVITNPTHYAVALQYQPGKSMAPVVLAKGTDLIAQKIREIATDHNVPLVANPPLARALHQAVDIDQEIPAEHYRAVAEIIAYVYKIKRKTRS